MASGNTIFISSTSADLAEFRAAAIHVAQRLGMRVVFMEDFGPDPRTAAALSEEKVRSADIFLGMYAYRYGFEPEGFGGISITQMEYAWAAEARLTILVFMADEDDPWPPKQMDTGESRIKLDRFKAAVKSERGIGRLTTPEKLREDLFVHLPKFRMEHPAHAASTVTSFPMAPRPYIAHTYTLLQTEQVIGRARELALLDRWVGDPGDRLHAARVLCLVAIGGMGKSALTWKWMHDHASVNMQPLAGRMWWSFYETDAGFNQFVIAALAYCTQRSIAAVGEMPRADREADLLAVLNEKPFLLVLDGIERLLIAYAGTDFAHLADDDLDRCTANVVSGALGLPGIEATAMVSQHRLRKTIDPHVGSFLRKLSRMQASRILMTTRLYPSEIQTATGHELPGCAAVFLRGVEAEDALALWRGMGVSGDDEELISLFSRFECYPLLIRALAGEVARFRRAPGDFDAWRSVNVDFNPFRLPLVQVKSHVLSHALRNLDSDALQVLRTIAAFRESVDYETLVGLYMAGEGERSVDRLDMILSELEDRGLLGWDRITNRYDLHPVVRGVVWSALDESTRHDVYDALRSHFEAIPPLVGNVQSLVQIRPAIELFNALIGLRKFDQAVEIFFGRILPSDRAFISGGAVNVKLLMLESLFPEDLDHLPGTTRDNAVLSQLGHAYWSAGRLNEAHRCYSKVLQRKLSGKGLFTAMTYFHLARTELLMGQLRNAVRHMKKAVEDHDDPLIDSFRANLAMCAAVMGEANYARRRLIHFVPAESPSRYLAQIAIWQGDFREAARRTASRAYRLSDEWILPVIVAESKIHLGDCAGAATLLTMFLKRVVELCLPRHEAEARRVMAELHRQVGELDLAREELDGLWELAERGGYRLTLADAYLVLAKIERDAGNIDFARTAATEAYKQAFCDGPPYTYHWALKKAEALIKELGATIPQIQAQVSPTGDV